MRKILIALVAVAASAAPAHAQFENFLGSQGNSGFDGSTAFATCLSGGTGTGMGGMGMTNCTSTAGGDYSFNSYSHQAGTFDGTYTAGFASQQGSQFGISSVWQMNEGPKVGGNTIGGMTTSSTSAGMQIEGGAWGSFQQGQSSTFNGWAGTTVTSNYSLGMMGGMGGGGGD